MHQFFLNIFELFFSFGVFCIRVLLGIHSFRNMFRKFSSENHQKIVVLGNGPSLSTTLSLYEKELQNNICVCVNQFATSKYFRILKPRYYVLWDPNYWNRNCSESLTKMIQSLVDILKTVDWKMTIFIPIDAKKWSLFKNLPSENTNIEISYVNYLMYYGEGFQKFIFSLYERNFLTIRAQNVLVEAIFLALGMKFKEILIVGADHTWTDELFVDDSNVLFLKNEHFNDTGTPKMKPFYKDGSQKVTFTMSEILKAFSLMFKGYEQLEQYSRYLGVKIYNCTEKTYIDAFERRKLKDLL